MAEDIIRVLRVLEYVGPRSFVEISLNQREVKGKRIFHSLGGYIHEAILGEFPEILTKGGDQET